ncbi:MAG TPA: hypothetical protein VGA75_05575, partial [Paracoccaceae bacterium]
RRGPRIFDENSWGLAPDPAPGLRSGFVRMGIWAKKKRSLKQIVGISAGIGFGISFPGGR